MSDPLTPTCRLRFIRRVITAEPLPEGLTFALSAGDRPPRMILQQWWEDGWRQVGEWRDVAVEVEG
jgi:hypothetical protein